MTVAEAWAGYLRATKGKTDLLYDRDEPLAWAVLQDRLELIPRKVVKGKGKVAA